MRERRLPFEALSLFAALSAPALFFLARSAHAFEVGAWVSLPFFSLMAAGAAWLRQGAPLRRPWAWILGAMLLLVLGYAVAIQPFALRKLQWADGSKLKPWIERGCLGLLGLGLAWHAWRPAAGRALPLAFWRGGLTLTALWAFSAALSFRADLGVEALQTWGSYGLVFAAAWAYATDAPRRRRLVHVLLFVGAINALWGLAQSAGLDPMPWNQSFNGRAIGFFGNPNYLGGHLALLLPLSLALALDGRGSAGRSFARWMLLALLATGLLLSGTRGAWAGAAVGCAALLVLAGRRAPGLLARRRRPLLLLLIVAALTSVVYVAAKPQALKRITDVLKGHDVEVERRGFLMHKSLQLALRHPWLGVGPGDFRIFFPSVETVGVAPEQLDRHPYVLSEHAHNDFLQMAADTGWPAALLWAGLSLLLLWRLFRGAFARSAPARAGSESLLLLGAGAALLAMDVHGLANFPFLIPATQASAWALAAVGLRALGQPSAGAFDEQALVEDAGAAAPAQPRWRRVSALLALTALLFTLGIVRGRRLVEDQLWWMGEGELVLKRQDTATNVLLRALDFDRREDRLWKLHGRSEYERNFIWNSIGSLREAVRLNPWDAEAAVRLGMALVENKAYDEAITVLRRVAAYAPNFIDVWEPLAAAEFEKGHFEEAVKAYDWMLYFHLNTESAYANKAAAQASQGRHQLPYALLTLKQAEQALPLSGKIQINLAITYLKLGMKGEARKAWAKANALLPSDPQVDQLKGVLY